MNLIDSHAHITCDLLIDRIDEVIENAAQANVSRILVICTDFITYERALALQHPTIQFDLALGFHPTDLNEFKEDDYERLTNIAQSGTLVAIGEIGLDYHWDNVEREVQKKGFIQQIEIANTLQLPIIVHMREATQDTLDILKEHCKVPFLMHCFSGSKEVAKIVMSMNGYISFAGPITFKNAKGLNEVPQVCDINRILVETDCPYLTPHPHRGKQNEVKYVAYTFEKVAELLEIQQEELAKIIENNYQSFIKNPNENSYIKIMKQND